MKPGHDSRYWEIQNSTWLAARAAALLFLLPLSWPQSEIEKHMTFDTKIHIVRGIQRSCEYSKSVAKGMPQSGPVSTNLTLDMKHLKQEGVGGVAVLL
ncbi:hypothetical protein M441DRAFT_56242 [Trichoderma asperellum CBS 433.97]|uniref:Uncharacterized protein n=1 Tax=Trichoderma asperellum (strain ATCC 204424 / CBS 433.97 / NBRC 101777) TaxID=1042311 RepID=A0A2T3ZEH2_TRIA4|nr:hypothetical protein M441DRAFT_56242 [Trichoderma asperellum CBS 433.97]PTB43208.1 hypothetical protein M441DRAFT_56242 [Trichoderma asperellum CBS 433.97]